MLHPVTPKRVQQSGQKGMVKFNIASPKETVSFRAGSNGVHRTVITTTLFLVLVATAISFAVPVNAATSGCDIKFIPSITIPGSNFIAGKEMSLNCSSLGEYVKSIYTVSVYAGSILAVVVLMIGGFMWLTSGGNVSQVGQARSYIGGAIAGFVLLLLSWTLLQTINPKLVEFEPLDINEVSNVPLPQLEIEYCCFCDGAPAGNKCNSILDLIGTCTCKSSSAPGGTKIFGTPSRDSCLNSTEGTECVFTPSTPDDLRIRCEDEFGANNCRAIPGQCTALQFCEADLLASGKAGPCSIIYNSCASGYVCNRGWVCDERNPIAGRSRLDRTEGGNGCCKLPGKDGSPCIDETAYSSGCAKGYKCEVTTDVFWGPFRGEVGLCKKQ